MKKNNGAKKQKPELNEEETTEEVTEETNQENEEIIKDENNDLLEAKEEEIKELTNKLMRLQADFQNFKKRVEKDKELTNFYALESIAVSILPSIDNLDRAMDSETDKESSMYKGVEMISTQLMKALNEKGIEEIKSLGEKFDPNYHHAIFMEESTEYEEGHITEVLQKGYIIKDRVIRPAMVKVAK